MSTTRPTLEQDRFEEDRVTNAEARFTRLLACAEPYARRLIRQRGLNICDCPTTDDHEIFESAVEALARVVDPTVTHVQVLHPGDTQHCAIVVADVADWVEAAYLIGLVTGQLVASPVLTPTRDHRRPGQVTP